jgi:hypothetical protein
MAAYWMGKFCREIPSKDTYKATSRTPVITLLPWLVLIAFKRAFNWFITIIIFSNAFVLCLYR